MGGNAAIKHDMAIQRAADCIGYGIIVVVVLNAILLASPLSARLIRHRHNLIPTLAYWPVVLGLLLAVTLVVFFRG